MAKSPIQLHVRTRRGVLLATAGVAALALLVGCGADETPAADGSTSISFQLDWVQDSEFSGYFLADNEGLFKDQGVEVSFLDNADGGSTAAVIAGGGAQMGIVSNLSRFFQAQQQGADLVVVGALFQTSPAGLMTLPDRPVTAIDDLAGLSIGTDESGVADLNTLFAVNGAKADYKPVRVGFDAAPLFEGKIDAYYAYLTSQPISYELQGEDFNTVTFADLGFQSYAGLIVTTRDFLDDNRDAVVGFVRAAQDGWQLALDDPENAADVTLASYGQDLGLDRAYEAAVVEKHKQFVTSDLTKSEGLFAMDPDLIAGDMYDALEASGLSDLPDPEDVIDFSVVKDAGASR